MAEEIEATLLVTGDDPESIFREIRQARALGSYRVCPGGRLEIRDRYFDTPGGTLGSARCALRVRNDGRQELLCLKSGEEAQAWGGVRRLEIEGPWSEEILSEILGQGGPLSCLRSAGYCDDPVKTLEGCGLMIIQSRLTSRSAIRVFDEEGRDGCCLAELALDRVCYVTGGREFLHYEIEVEAKTGGAIQEMERLVNHLGDAYPEALMPWSHNKLLTGFALDHVLNSGTPPGESRGGSLIPLSWYTAMDEWIRGGWCERNKV